MSHQTSFDLIRKIQFTPDLKQYLKNRAHTFYDEIYLNLYVGDFPTDQLPNEADDAGYAFERNWLRQVTEPLLAGYAFASPHDDTDDPRNALREVGFLFGHQIGWDKREDYDDVERLTGEAFDQVFAQEEGESRMKAHIHQAIGAPVLRVEDAHTRKAFDLLTRDQALGLPLTNARTQLTDILLRRGIDEAVAQALTAGGFTVHADDPFAQ